MKTITSSLATVVILLIFICLLLMSKLSAQAPTKAWDKRYGGSSTDFLYSLTQTSDGGYIMGGESDSDISGDKTETNQSAGTYDYWIVKIDVSGTLQWDKRFGGSNDDRMRSLVQTTDGGYMFAGQSQSPASGDKTSGVNFDYDYWIVKTDATGTKQWDKSYRGAVFYDQYLTCIQKTTDGGYILAGFSYSPIGGDKTENNRDVSNSTADYWLVKTDANGNKLWDKRFGGNGGEECAYVIQTSDGGYLAGGVSYSGISGDKTEASQGSGDYWIVKIDASGNKQWDKRFGGSDAESFAYCQQTDDDGDGQKDDGYILGGSSSSGISGDKTEASRGNSDYWIVKTDASGNKQWDKRFGGSSVDQMTVVIEVIGGGYVLGGNAGTTGIEGDKTEINCNGSIFYDYWLVRTDANGNKLWDKRFGGDQPDIMYAAASLQNPTDTAMLLGGHSRSGITCDKSEASQGGWDYWVLKTTKVIPLPIELLSFDATPVKDSNNKYYVRCEWSTATEINNDYFIIERSQNGKTFAHIGKVDGAGNSNTTLYYEFDDQLPYTDLSYYRLKQTDYDGKFSYSNIVPVFIGGINLISIAPNPVIDNFEYKIGSTEKMSVQVRVVDILGQIVINKTETIEKGITSKRLDVAGLSSGMYILELITENKEVIGKQFQIK